MRHTSKHIKVQSRAVLFSFPQSDVFFLLCFFFFFSNTSSSPARSENMRGPSSEPGIVHCGSTDVGIREDEVATCPLAGALWTVRSGISPLTLRWNGKKCDCWLVSESNPRSRRRGGPQTPHPAGLKCGVRSERRGAGPRCSWPSGTRPAGGTATRPPAPAGRWSDAGSFGPG